MTFSCSHACPTEDIGRRRNIEPWFSTEISGGGCRRDSDRVGLEPDDANAFFMVVSTGTREGRQMKCSWGKAKVGFCPLQAVSLQLLEAGTVTFSLVRLPER